MSCGCTTKMRDINNKILDEGDYVRLPFCTRIGLREYPNGVCGHIYTNYEYPDVSKYFLLTDGDWFRLAIHNGIIIERL